MRHLSKIFIFQSGAVVTEKTSQTYFFQLLSCIVAQLSGVHRHEKSTHFGQLYRRVVKAVHVLVNLDLVPHVICEPVQFVGRQRYNLHDVKPCNRPAFFRQAHVGTPQDGTLHRREDYSNTRNIMFERYAILCRAKEKLNMLKVQLQRTSSGKIIKATVVMQLVSSQKPFSEYLRVPIRRNKSMKFSAEALHKKLNL
jgi:hypothetical protein